MKKTRRIRKFVATIIALILLTMMVVGFILIFGEPAEELSMAEFAIHMIVKTIAGIALLVGGGYIAIKIYE